MIEKAILLAMLAPLALSARAQSVIAVSESGKTTDAYGRDVAFIGDANGDGVSEYAVGADGANKAYVYDGRDSSLLLTLQTGSGFGYTVDGADWNGDGLADVAVGAYGVEKVRIFSGLDGSMFIVWDGIASDLSFIGDVDGDAVPDLLCAPYEGPPPQLGQVRVSSAATGAVLFDHFGAVNNHLGAALDAPGDVDGDGVPDYAFGVPGDDTLAAEAGAVEVHSGATGGLIWKALGSAHHRNLGSSLTTLGDVDLDGTPDLAAGAPGGLVSYVRILSGADGSTITNVYEPEGMPAFGFSLGTAGDATGDGRPDILIRMGTSLDERIALVDLLSTDTVFTFISEKVGHIAGLGALDSGHDLNGDGAVDFVSSWFDMFAPPFTAPVYAISTVDLPFEHLDHALPGGPGKPVLRAEGSLAVATTITLRIAQVKKSAPGWLVAGLTPVNAPLKGGVLVPAVDVLLPIAADASGRLELAGTWPAGLPSGFTTWLQGWFIDAGAPEGFSATNALAAEQP